MIWFIIAALCVIAHFSGREFELDTPSWNDIDGVQ